jgi:transcriptional regulator with XRE-family HTH domain
MKRSELLRSKEYWLTKIQAQVFESVDSYRSSKKLTQTAFAKELGVSKGYISQVLNGDFDHRISKLVDLSLAIGKAPYLVLKDIDELIEIDAKLENGSVYNNFYESVINVNFINVSVHQSIAMTAESFNEIGGLDAQGACMYIYGGDFDSKDVAFYENNVIKNG